MATNSNDIFHLSLKTKRSELFAPIEYVPMGSPQGAPPSIRLMQHRLIDKDSHGFFSSFLDALYERVQPDTRLDKFLKLMLWLGVSRTFLAIHLFFFQLVALGVCHAAGNCGDYDNSENPLEADYTKNRVWLVTIFVVMGRIAYMGATPAFSIVQSARNKLLVEVEKSQLPISCVHKISVADGQIRQTVSTNSALFVIELTKAGLALFLGLCVSLFVSQFYVRDAYATVFLPQLVPFLLYPIMNLVVQYCDIAKPGYRTPINVLASLFLGWDFAMATSLGSKNWIGVFLALIGLEHEPTLLAVCLWIATLVFVVPTGIAQFVNLLDKALTFTTEKFGQLLYKALSLPCVEVLDASDEATWQSLVLEAKLKEYRAKLAALLKFRDRVDARVNEKTNCNVRIPMLRLDEYCFETSGSFSDMEVLLNQRMDKIAQEEREFRRVEASVGLPATPVVNHSVAAVMDTLPVLGRSNTPARPLAGGMGASATRSSLRAGAMRAHSPLGSVRRGQTVLSLLQVGHGSSGSLTGLQMNSPSGLGSESGSDDDGSPPSFKLTPVQDWRQGRSQQRHTPPGLPPAAAPQSELHIQVSGLVTSPSLPVRHRSGRAKCVRGMLAIGVWFCSAASLITNALFGYTSFEGTMGTGYASVLSVVPVMMLFCMNLVLIDRVDWQKYRDIKGDHFTKPSLWLRVFLSQTPALYYGFVKFDAFLKAKFNMRHDSGKDGYWVCMGIFIGATALVQTLSKGGAEIESVYAATNKPKTPPGSVERSSKRWNRDAIWSQNLGAVGAGGLHTHVSPESVIGDESKGAGYR